MLKSTETCIFVRTCNEKFKHTVPFTGGPQFTNPQHPLPIHRGPNFSGAEVPTLKTNNSPTGTVSIHFPTYVTTMHSENAHI